MVFPIHKKIKWLEWQQDKPDICFDKADEVTALNNGTLLQWVIQWLCVKPPTFLLKFKFYHWTTAAPYEFLRPFHWNTANRVPTHFQKPFSIFFQYLFNTKLKDPIPSLSLCFQTFVHQFQNIFQTTLPSHKSIV